MPVGDSSRAIAADQSTAINPTTDPTLLAEIAQHRPDLRPALAMNPAAYPALLAWLANLNDPVVNAALAARHATTEPPEQPPAAVTQTLPIAAGSAPAQPPVTSPPPVTAPPRRRRVLPAALATITILAVAGAAVWAFLFDGLALLDRSDDGVRITADSETEPPRPTPEPAETTVAAAEAPTVAAPTPAMPAQPVISAPDLTGCGDTKSAAAELTSYATSLGSAASDPAATSQLTSALSAAEAMCGVTHAADIAQALSRQPGIPGEIQQATDIYLSSTIRFPAPAGSVMRPRIDSPEKNISCELEESSVGCSILERSYPVADDCPDRLFSAVIFNGTAQTACGTEWLGEVGDDFYHISYGETVTFGFMACTVEADGPRRGMTCWDTRTGNSFRVSRAIFEVDNSW